LKDFYHKIFDTNLEYDCEVRIHSSVQIRAELFKLCYTTGDFLLHEKADAFKVLEYLLQVLHAWSLPASNQDLNKLVQATCTPQCFAHEGFF
jgi:hypothetical protein